ncbi:hypothetical protein pben1_p61 [Paracoccus phage vB_PbeS_Pben1]|nr:hypothetical protein pben1_p61 [Paracoccus phage vB_PbeS_Pben1]
MRKPRLPAALQPGLASCHPNTKRADPIPLFRNRNPPLGCPSLQHGNRGLPSPRTFVPFPFLPSTGTSS